jgi:hypothetical protein
MKSFGLGMGCASAGEVLAQHLQYSALENQLNKKQHHTSNEVYIK